MWPDGEVREVQKNLAFQTARAMGVEVSGQGPGEGGGEGIALECKLWGALSRMD